MAVPERDRYLLAVTQTLTPPKTRPRIDGGGTGLGGGWKVIVKNDDHNTFEGVAFALAQTIPNTSYEKGLKFANEVHTKGLAIVWQGHKELAEHYHDQLAGFGLTMADLEQ